MKRAGATPPLRLKMEKTFLKSLAYTITGWRCGHGAGDAGGLNFFRSIVTFSRDRRPEFA
jgi:hypothetical protein